MQNLERKCRAKNRIHTHKLTHVFAFALRTYIYRNELSRWSGGFISYLIQFCVERFERAVERTIEWERVRAFAYVANAHITKDETKLNQQTLIAWHTIYTQYFLFSVVLFLLIFSIDLVFYFYGVCGQRFLSLSCFLASPFHTASLKKYLNCKEFTIWRASERVLREREREQLKANNIYS